MRTQEITTSGAALHEHCSPASQLVVLSGFDSHISESHTCLVVQPT